MTNRYRRANLTDLETNAQKPGQRYEVSPQLDLEAYNYNVATLDTGTGLSQNAYHYHENQTEFFHALDGRCRVEVEDDAFVLDPDDLVAFEPGIAHLLHNPYDRPCRVIAIGSPPEGRYPVEQVQSYDDLLEERYGGDVPTDGSEGATSDERRADRETSTNDETSVGNETTSDTEGR